MGNYIPNLCCVDGAVIRLPVRKKVADTYAMRAGRVAAFVCSRHPPLAAHFAVRQEGVWQLYPASGPASHPLRKFPSQAAAEMWLLHRGTTANLG